jgi:hypothetical protein
LRSRFIGSTTKVSIPWTFIPTSRLGHGRPTMSSSGNGPVDSHWVLIADTDAKYSLALAHQLHHAHGRVHCDSLLRANRSMMAAHYTAHNQQSTCPGTLTRDTHLDLCRSWWEIQACIVQNQIKVDQEIVLARVESLFEPSG